MRISDWSSDVCSSDLVDAQTTIHVENMKQQAQDAQSQRELQMQAERDAMKLANERELEMFKAQLQRQTALDTAQISAQSAAFAAANKPTNEADRKRVG